MPEICETPDLEKIVLARGAHSSREAGCCAMELVAWIAGEEHSDHPRCVDPILGALGRRWNDVLDDDSRQRLKPFLPRMVGTALDGRSQERAFAVADWAIREIAPMYLDFAALGEFATPLRTLPPLVDMDSIAAARPILAAARKAAEAARLSAYKRAIAIAIARLREKIMERLAPVLEESRESAFKLLERML